MRRKEREISQQEAMAVLQKAEYGVLSIASLDGEPYGVPLNYCVLNNAIYFHCANEGKKLDVLSSNNSVSFCSIGVTKVLSDKFGMQYESAIISGKAEEVTGSEKQFALEGIIKKYSSAFFSKGLEQIKTNIAKTRVYKIVIQSITGKARK
jgi:nitroimidazol reductase NimA-like FMN-containing flavoprotein (pyridoxamine 5'-phosphate oxidase superfamily)